MTTYTFLPFINTWHCGDEYYDLIDDNWFNKNNKEDKLDKWFKHATITEHIAYSFETRTISSVTYEKDDNGNLVLNENGDPISKRSRNPLPLSDHKEYDNFKENGYDHEFKLSGDGKRYLASKKVDRECYILEFDSFDSIMEYLEHFNFSIEWNFGKYFYNGEKLTCIVI